LAGLVSANPGWVAGQQSLASLRWELGDQREFARDFRSSLSRNPGQPEMWNAYIATLGGVGDHLGAADAAAEAGRHFPVPILKLIEANQASTAGELQRAETLLASLPNDMAERPSVEARHAIRVGDLDRASDQLARWRKADPDDLSAWALTDVVWRARGDDRADWLIQPEMVRTTELPLPPDQLEQLAMLLRSLHKLRSMPIGQSVRGGTQTRGKLFDRREPELLALRVMLDEAIDAYRAGLPPADPTHPLLKHRARTFRADGGWSVRLTDAGYHVPHLHPAGILSSACYIAVPQLEREQQEGWLELGRPPEDLCLPLEPLAAIEPLSGRLNLFPSFLYHGTRPFGAGERLSVAFDAR
jgi:tetratricopeptide (TPR) repeat protein